MSSLVIVVLFAVNLFLVRGQFPTVCVTQEGLKSRTCCPIPEGFTESCGGSGRGSCETVTPSNEGNYEPHFEWLQDDDRASWPSTFFDMACECEYPFWGADCSQCMLGFYGSECTEQKTLVRKDVSENEDVAILYLTYINWMRTNISSYSVLTTQFKNMINADGSITPKFVEVSIFEFYIWIHHYASKEYDYTETTYPFYGYSHLSSDFLIWHRLYLAQFEHELQRLSGNYDFALPYWTWSGLHECDICTPDLFGTDYGNLVNNKYIGDFVMICDAGDLTTPCDPTIKYGPVFRNNTFTEAPYPYKHEVGFLLNMKAYDTPPYNPYSNCSFRNIMGGNGGTEDGLSQYENVGRYMHARAHFKLGGVMSSIPSSANDPIFHVLHAYMDKVFEMWYRIHRPTIDMYPENGAAIGHNRYSYQVPMFPVHQHNESFVTSLAMGYDYDDMDEYGHTSDWDEIYTENTGACP